MRYFFDFSDPEGIQKDVDGVAYETFDRMCREAKRSIARIAEEFVGSNDNMNIELHVRDEMGIEVYNLRLSVEGKRARCMGI
jgi:hypothetical protein